MLHFAFEPMDALDFLIRGRSHFLLNKGSLSFKNVVIFLASARSGACIFNSPMLCF